MPLRSKTTPAPFGSARTVTVAIAASGPWHDPACKLAERFPGRSVTFATALDALEVFAETRAHFCHTCRHRSPLNADVTKIEEERGLEEGRTDERGIYPSKRRGKGRPAATSSEGPAPDPGADLRAPGERGPGGSGEEAAPASPQDRPRVAPGAAGPPLKIYLASSWRNPRYEPALEALRAAGHDVYDFKNPPGRTGFHWSAVFGDDWRSGITPEAFRDGLEHPVAIAGFDSDMEHLVAADLCVLALPCGRSAHLELGFAVGAGKPTIILAETLEEPELMYRMVTRVVTSIGELVSFAGAIADARATLRAHGALA